jgi:hypothetical protein
MAKEKINKQIGIRVTEKELADINTVFLQVPRTEFERKNDFLRKALLMGVKTFRFGLEQKA